MQLSDDEIKKWLAVAYDVARQSPDNSTQIGSLIFSKTGNLIGSGYNGFTPGIEASPKNLERERKYEIISHSERAAIYSVLAGGHTSPHTMISTWAACSQCAIGIVQSGITRLIRHKKDPASHWAKSVLTGDMILEKAGVEIIDFEGEIGCAPILQSGELYFP